MGLLLPISTGATDIEPLPQFDIRIKPLTLDEPRFTMSGSIRFCAKSGRKVAFVIPRGSTYSFTRNGAALDVSPQEGIDWPCEPGAAITFFGTSPVSMPKCGASHQEIYCLNRSLPNPEVISDSSRYQLHFELLKGYGGLSPDPSIALNYGIQFQIAQFAAPRRRKTKHFTFEYQFPKDFSPEDGYLDFIEKTLEDHAPMFGALPFHKVLVGAIRRGETTGEISGSPAGNLILFSRTALRDKPNLESLRGMGIQADVSDALRKMVIAHELSHFWFGRSFTGKDGWMVEGIPNYIGLVAVAKGSKGDYAELRKLFEYMDSQGPPGPIPNSPFGNGPLYIRAYYQGSLALAKIGDVVGHEKVLELVAGVYRHNADPAFADFDEAFKKAFPSQAALWTAAWKLTPQSGAQPGK
ncbi:MAG: hypothetical protein PHF00_13395 [Elusimicrobia bacterium]|nr:hypothetical protein [Elusimicrobiota bacterium]